MALRSPAGFALAATAVLLVFATDTADAFNGQSLGQHTGVPSGHLRNFCEAKRAVRQQLRPALRMKEDGDATKVRPNRSQGERCWICGRTISLGRTSCCGCPRRIWFLHLCQKSNTCPLYIHLDDFLRLADCDNICIAAAFHPCKSPANMGRRQADLPIIGIGSEFKKTRIMIAVRIVMRFQ